MSPVNNSQQLKEKESEKDESALNDPFAKEKMPEKPGWEAGETLTESDRERLKQEVLEEISAQEEMKPAVKPVPAAVAEPVLATAKSPTLVKIESILEEDLQDAYFSLDSVTRQEFKAEGEKTAAKIEELLLAVKVRTGKILQLILDWLKIIPGLNRFFLRQEAKIKTDKIIKLKERK